MDDFDLAEFENHLQEEDIESQNPDFYYGEQHRFAFRHLFHQCFWPTSSQTLEIVGPLVGLCLVVRTIAALPLPRWLVHLTSLATGCVAMYLFMDKFSGYPVVMCLIGYSVLYLPLRFNGPLMSLFCLVYILTCELFIASPDSWHKVRGTQMILAMKIISVAFDLDQGVLSKRPNPLEYLGYSLSSSSIIFGPFMSYDNYMHILAGKRLTWSWVFGIFKTAILSYICLIHSVCISPYVFAEADHKWLLAYQSAMSFRFSHYFVSFLSECTSLACGVYTEVKENNEIAAKWKFDVSRPYHVELPRSLVEVVIHWNIPNHVFLKNYVFKRARSLGRFIAILLTFGCSALLHGLNIQLAAVLLSIGIYAYIEHVLRSRLAGFFSACISARKCKPDCSHHYKDANFWVITINLAFSFLSVFHLAYLGIMFGGDAAEQEQGFDVKRALRKWTELDFLSHWVALSSFILSMAVPKPAVN